MYECQDEWHIVAINIHYVRYFALNYYKNILFVCFRRHYQPAIFCEQLIIS